MKTGARGTQRPQLIERPPASIPQEGDTDPVRAHRRNVCLDALGPMDLDEGRPGPETKMTPHPESPSAAPGELEPRLAPDATQKPIGADQKPSADRAPGGLDYQPAGAGPAPRAGLAFIAQFQ